MERGNTFNQTLIAYTIGEVKNEVDRFPTAEVEPVIHGHWIMQEKGVYISSADYPLRRQTKLYVPDFYNCSVCGRRETYQEPYCHCGAKMDEKMSDKPDFLEN